MDDNNFVASGRRAVKRFRLLLEISLVSLKLEGLKIKVPRRVSLQFNWCTILSPEDPFSEQFLKEPFFKIISWCEDFNLFQPFVQWKFSMDANIEFYFQEFGSSAYIPKNKGSL